MTVTGKIIPTTDTYKYHMQLQEDNSSAPASPREVTPLKLPQSETPVELPQSETLKTAGEVKSQLVSQSAAGTSSPTSSPESPKLLQNGGASPLVQDVASKPAVG